MAPNQSDDVIISDSVDTEQTRPQTKEQTPRTYEIVWLNVFVFVYYHLAAIYGLYLCVSAAMWKTILFNFFIYVLTALGVTAGVHRLWSHKTYKAKKPLQVFLMLCHCIANQHTAIHWARNHRLHHKFSDTDADPHNSRRGFFYSHIGWVLTKKHPEARSRAKTVDLSDLTSNPVLQFQERYANWLIITMAFILPTFIPYLWWNEKITVAYHLNMLRYVIGLNATFMVNSVAHMWGYRPYDKTIPPADNMSVSIMTLGEGSHNYHHAFPHDYRTAEFGISFCNPTTIFIDFCALIGQAYDRRFAGDDVVKARIQRTG